LKKQKKKDVNDKKGHGLVKRQSIDGALKN